jgi:hypothetical protein
MHYELPTSASEMNIFFWRRKIRHPFFPDVAAEPAAAARGRRKALAGTFGELLGAAARGAEARRAVYVLTSEHTPLSDGERDELWRLFEVPVYALIERDGRVAAWECEAQNGLHGSGIAEKSACACGRPGAVSTAMRTAAQAAD